MGRLFWKLLFSFWLALILVSAGVGIIVWVSHPENPDPNSEESSGSSPESLIMKVAVSTLHYGGIDALKALLEDVVIEDLSTNLFVIDDNGLDILKRTIDASLIEKARDSATESDSNNSARVIITGNGNRLLLFTLRDIPPFLNSRVNNSPPSSMIPRPIPTSQGGSNFPGDSRGPSDFNMPPDQRGFREPGGPNFGPPNLYSPPSFWSFQNIFSSSAFQWFLNGSAALIASLVFSGMLAWYLVSPIRHIRKAFAAAERGDLDTRIQPLIGSRRDEIADLGRAYDKMADKLQDLMNVQKRLFHDVSHELRSPLARLQAATGLARQNTAEIDKALVRIELEIDRMDILVGEILVLARLDSDVTIGNLDTIDPSDLIEEIIEDASFEAKSQDIDIVYEQKACHLQIQGRVDLLARAFDNVIRNAIKYSPLGSKVQVTAVFEPEQAILKILICDQGRGVLKNELSAIFEPFYRGSNSPSRAGYGLGLAIARRAIESHKGSIQAFNLAESGLCVSIELPASIKAEEEIKE